MLGAEGSRDYHKYCSCTVVGSDRRLTGIRLVDQTSTDAGRVGSCNRLSGDVITRATERLHVLATLSVFPHFRDNVLCGGSFPSASSMIDWWKRT